MLLSTILTSYSVNAQFTHTMDLVTQAVQNAFTNLVDTPGALSPATSENTAAAYAVPNVLLQLYQAAKFAGAPCVNPSSTVAATGQYTVSPALI